MNPPPIAYDGRELVTSHGSHLPVRVVLHDTESHDTAGIGDLRGIAEFWHRQGRGYGAHVGVDKEGNSARYVSDDLIGWHVQDRNTGSLGVEQIGFASFPLAVWWTRPRQLQTVARWLAYWSDRYGIPLRLHVERGVSTHAMQSEAYGGGHYDPGRGYPLRFVVQLARTYKRFPPAV